MAILSALLSIPALGALLLVLISGQNTCLIRLISNLATSLVLLLACYITWQFDPSNAALQFSEYYPLNPKLGSAYALGVDGLSMPMLLLASLLSSVAVLVSFSISENIKGYHICLLRLKVTHLRYLFDL